MVSDRYLRGLAKGLRAAVAESARGPSPHRVTLSGPPSAIPPRAPRASRWRTRCGLARGLVLHAARRGAGDDAG